MCIRQGKQHLPASGRKQQAHRANTVKPIIQNTIKKKLKWLQKQTWNNNSNSSNKKVGASRERVNGSSVLAVSASVSASVVLLCTCIYSALVIIQLDCELRTTAAPNGLCGLVAVVVSCTVAAADKVTLTRLNETFNGREMLERKKKSWQLCRQRRVARWQLLCPLCASKCHRQMAPSVGVGFLVCSVLVLMMLMRAPLSQLSFRLSA